MEGVIAFDIDRVLFDTDGFLEELKKRYPEKLEEVFAMRRKDLSRIYDILKKVGRAKELFELVEKYGPNKEIKKVLERLSKRFLLVVLTTGDHLQLLKIKDLPVTGAVLAKDDEEKIKKALELSSLHKRFIVIDDKEEIVRILRKNGIEAYRAEWYTKIEAPKLPGSWKLKNIKALEQLLLKL